MDPEPARLLWLDHSFLLAINPQLEVVFGLLGVVLLLLCSAMVSGSEIAFFSLNENDYERLEEEKDKANDRILRLKDEPRKLLATILISNNFINIAIVILSDFVLLRFLPDATFERWASRIVEGLGAQNLISATALSDGINFLLITLGITFLLVLFGEVAPKVYAKINNIKLARLMALPLQLMMQVFGPISFLLVNMTNVIEHRLDERGSNQRSATREDIDEAIELTVSRDKDTEQEVDILKSIVKFGDVSVKQIMRSRVDIEGLEFRSSYRTVLGLARNSGYSRIPVYENDLDNIAGILYVKDLLGHLQEGDAFEWQEIIRTNVLYVPEAKKIDDLLKEFQRERLHMAIVVDEYGGTAGLVTLEDIMEEIIGDIKDEFDDEPEVLFQRLGPRQFSFEGKTMLNDVCRIIGIDTSTFDEVKGESDSLAGLVLEIFGGIPRKDIELEYNNFRFKVVSVSKRRIEKIILSLPEDLDLQN